MSRAMADGLLHDLRTLDARHDPAGANLAMRDAAQLLDGLDLHHIRERTLETHQDWLEGRVSHQAPILREVSDWDGLDRQERAETDRFRLAMAFLAGMATGVVALLLAAIAVGMSS